MIASLNTITARTVLVLFVAMGLLHVASLSTYRSAVETELASNSLVQMADRLVGIRRAVMHVEPPEREKVAHALAGGPIDVHWSLTEHAVTRGQVAEPLPGLLEELRRREPDLAGGGLIAGASSPLAADPHVTVISMALPDRSWVNVSILDIRAGSTSSHGTIYSTTVMTVGLALAAVVLVRWLTGPLRAFAGAANQFAAGAQIVTVPERGPEELRQLAAAFNDMQVKIKKLLDDRTQTLAAISHDLRSPLTRLKLSIEDLLPAQREEMAAAIEEMEVMIEGTLAFLKSDRLDEPVRAVDLVSIVETVALDFMDQGRPVSLKVPDALVVNGRKVALKRAVTNVIDNALKYGGSAEVSVQQAEGKAFVSVRDHGPGIPAAEREAVFAPFHRLEGSRNKETGGVGLGLTVSRSVVRAHGGEVTVGEADGGGLLVEMEIPLAGPP